MNKQSEKLKVKGEKYKICATDFEGITLVALVITIIVLIILAAVSINAVMNDGLIKNAEEAAGKYEDAQKEEETELGKLMQEIENATGRWKFTDSTKTKVTDGTVTLKVGDYVAYEPQTEVATYEISNVYSGYGTESKTYTKDTLNWRVLGVNENGRLELISDNVTSQPVYFVYYQGFNNGVYLINNMCNTLYGNEESGTIGRGLAIEDIQNVMDLTIFDYHDYTGYGSKETSTGVYYPTMLSLEKGQTVGGTEGSKYGQSEQEELIVQTREEWNLTNDITVTQTSWSNSFQPTNFIDEIYYTLFGFDWSYDAPYYWLSSRCVNITEYSIEFGLMYKGDINSLSGSFIVDSTRDEGSLNGLRLRPVVTLGSSIQIDTTDDSKDGASVATAWAVK